MTENQVASATVGSMLDMPVSTPPPLPPSPTLAELEAEERATAEELKRHEAVDEAERKAAQKPSMGRMVIVRHGEKKVPAVIVDVREDGSIDVQAFHADHMPHSAHRLQEIDADGTGDGWYWPKRT
jgi:hypothetical protein